MISWDFRFPLTICAQKDTSIAHQVSTKTPCWIVAQSTSWTDIGVVLSLQRIARVTVTALATNVPMHAGSFGTKKFLRMTQEKKIMSGYRGEQWPGRW